MYLNDIDATIFFASRSIAKKSMAVFKQWYRKFGGQYLHPRLNGAKVEEAKVNGTKTNEPKLNGNSIPPKIKENEIEATVTQLNSASATLNAYLHEHSNQVPSSQGSLDIPLTEENGPYHESKSAVLDAAERLIALVKGPRDVVLALSFQVSIWSGITAYTKSFDIHL